MKINTHPLYLVDNTNFNLFPKNHRNSKFQLPQAKLNSLISSRSRSVDKFTSSIKFLKNKWLKDKLYRLVKSYVVSHFLKTRPSSTSFMTKKLWRVIVRFIIRKRLPLFNSLSLLKLSSISLSSKIIARHPSELNEALIRLSLLILSPQTLTFVKNSRQRLYPLTELLSKTFFSSDARQPYFHREFYKRESFFGVRSKTSLAGGNWNFKRFTKYLFTEAYSRYGGAFFKKWFKISSSITKKKRFYKSTKFLPLWKQCKNILNELHKSYSYNYVNWFFSEPVRVFVKRNNSITIHNLVLKFNHHQFFISLLDIDKRRNYFSLLPGLLLKHIEGSRKSAKKALTTKLLLMRFLRKLLIISRIKNLNVVIKGVPLFIVQLFTFLNNPLTHTIKDPFTKKIIDETGDQYTIFNYFQLFFLRPKPYGYQKTRKKGRVKRKIRRKIARSARVIDEF